MTKTKGFKKLAVGTKVRVRKDLETGSYIHHTGEFNSVTRDMLVQRGKEFIIDKQYEAGYRLRTLEGKKIAYGWTSEMLEDQEVKKSNPLTKIEWSKAVYEINRAGVLHHLNHLEIALEHILYSNKVVIIFGKNAKTKKEVKMVAKLADGDTFDLQKGIKAAVLKFTIRKLQREFDKI